MSEKYVTPARVEHQKIELTGLDLMYGFFYTDIVIFLEKSFDTTCLESSLSKTIEQIPALGGKLVAKGDRVILDTNGPGVLFEREHSDSPTPPFGDEVFPIVGHDFCTPVPDPRTRPLEELPLVTVKVTTFADGLHCIGVRHNHALADAVGLLSFLFAWDGVLRGNDPQVPYFARDELLALAQGDGASPSQRSGIPCAEGKPKLTPPKFFATEFASVGLSAAQYAQVVAIAKASADDITVNDLLNAMIFKVYGESSLQADHDMAMVNLPFDLRRVKEVGLPPNYFGNSVLLRSMQMPFGELRQYDLPALAKLLAEFCRPDLPSIKQDVAFFQSQYQAARFNSHGVYTGFTPCVANGGLYINNTIQNRKHQLNFGDAHIGGGLIVKQPFGLRSVLLITMRQGDIYLRVTLEKNQIEAFCRRWSLRVERLLRDGLK